MLKEQILSWNGKYYYDEEDGIWCYVDSGEEVDHLPFIHCDKCCYAGEDENDGDVAEIECIHTSEDLDVRIDIYRCNKCGQLYINKMRVFGEGDYDGGEWDELTEEEFNFSMEKYEERNQFVKSFIDEELNSECECPNCGSISSAHIRPLSYTRLMCIACGHAFEHHREVEINCPLIEEFAKFVDAKYCPVCRDRLKRKKSIRLIDFYEIDGPTHMVDTFECCDCHSTFEKLYCLESGLLLRTKRTK